MDLLALLAFIAKVCLLGRLLAGHLELCDGGLGVAAKVSKAAGLSPCAGTVL